MFPSSMAPPPFYTRWGLPCPLCSAAEGLNYSYPFKAWVSSFICPQHSIRNLCGAVNQYIKEVARSESSQRKDETDLCRGFRAEWEGKSERQLILLMLLGLAYNEAKGALGVERNF